jgi:hypothetical protein
MRAALSKKELDALKHRHLKFNEAEQAAILRKLRSRQDRPQGASQSSA